MNRAHLRIAGVSLTVDGRAAARFFDVDVEGSPELVGAALGAALGAAAAAPRQLLRSRPASPRARYCGDCGRALGRDEGRKRCGKCRAHVGACCALQVPDGTCCKTCAGPIGGAP